MPVAAIPIYKQRHRVFKKNQIYEQLLQVCSK
jgi:hypothetical protein